MSNGLNLLHPRKDLAEMVIVFCVSLIVPEDLMFAIKSGEHVYQESSFFVSPLSFLRVSWWYQVSMSWCNCSKMSEVLAGAHMDVSENRGAPKSSILIGFSIIFTIHFGIPLFLETPICFFLLASCWWKKSCTQQLRLVVYPIIYDGFEHHPKRWFSRRNFFHQQSHRTYIQANYNISPTWIFLQFSANFLGETSETYPSIWGPRSCTEPPFEAVALRNLKG